MTRMTCRATAALMALAIIASAAGAQLQVPKRTPAAPRPSPDSLVRAAISAAGGAAALGAARALEWDARAIVHLRGRDIALNGTWRMLPPDSAISTTWETEKGPAGARSLVISGPRGWLQRDTALVPMPEAQRVEERHQFYLYSLLRLITLKEPGVGLVATRPDADGNPGLRVARASRLPVEMYFDRSGRVARMSTTFATNNGTLGDAQDIRLEGEVESNGITWFRKMTIRRAGKPYFELEITALRVRPSLSDPMLAGWMRR